MEKEGKTIVTNPLFKQIAEGCWQELNGTDEMDSLETIRSHREFIPEAIQKSPTVQEFCPGAVISSNQVIGLWREMRSFGLVSTEVVAKGRWKRVLYNPKRFNWKTSKKAGYLWFKRKPKKEEAMVAEAAPECAMEVVSKEELSPEAIIKDELTAAQLRLQQLETKKNSCQEEINRLEQLISPFQKVLGLCERLISLELEKISLLQPEQEGTK